MPLLLMCTRAEHSRLSAGAGRILQSASTACDVHARLEAAQARQRRAPPGGRRRSRCRCSKPSDRRVASLSPRGERWGETQAVIRGQRDQRREKRELEQQHRAIGRAEQIRLSPPDSSTPCSRAVAASDGNGHWPRSARSAVSTRCATSSGARRTHRKQRQEFAEPSPGRQEMQRLRQEEKAQAVRHGESVAVSRFEQQRQVPREHGGEGAEPGVGDGEKGGSGQSQRPAGTALARSACRTAPAGTAAMFRQSSASRPWRGSEAMSHAMPASRATPRLPAMMARNRRETILLGSAPNSPATGSKINFVKSEAPKLDNAPATKSPRISASSMGGLDAFRRTAYPSQAPTLKPKLPCVLWVSTEVTFQSTL